MSWRAVFVVVVVVMMGCSNASTPGDAGKMDAAPSDASNADAADAMACDTAFQNLVFSNAAGVTGGSFMGPAKGDNSGGQPFLMVSEGVGRSFDVEFFDMNLPMVGKVFDYGMQGTPGGPDTAWGSYVEGMNVLTPVSGKVTVICSKGRFLAVSLTNVVLKNDPDAGMTSITVNGSIGATIP